MKRKGLRVLILVILAAMVFALLFFTRNTTVATPRIKETPTPQAYDGFPYLEEAAWPVMRGDLQNTGRSRFLGAVPERSSLHRPVYFRTGNGIFSTPVIDGQDRIYVGSADHYFYALDPLSGEIIWKHRTGEIIDSAAALGKAGYIYVPSGDSKIYALDRNGQERWTFDVLHDRPQALFSTSTCFWWEGNVVIGPDSFIYGGNDDFYFYCLDAGGNMRWAYRTGFFIWAAAAFDRDHTVYVPSFDMRLYALDRRNGRLQWKRDLGNALVSSPCIGDNGTIYQGVMDGALYALHPDSGDTIWTAQTGSHIYASAAVSPDNVVYVTSSDGQLYAFSAETGELRWTFYAGEAVRSSPALGPDPEGSAPYLIYFGGGNGHVYCIDPHGARRWSYDTLVEDARYVDYPNINASPALGRTGLAAASANGNVVWIPYAYYLEADAVGIVREPGDGFEAEGAAWHYVSPGGQIDREPLLVESETQPIAIHPFQTISLHLLARQNGKTIPAIICPDRVRIQTTPPSVWQIEVLGDGSFMALSPDTFLEPDHIYNLRVTAAYLTRTGGTDEVEGLIRLKTPPLEPAHIRFSQEWLCGAYEITHMAVPLPPIVPSLDQIGLASLSIPFTIIEHRPDTGAFTAWGVQSFGETSEGDLVGVPDSRTLFYAFAGCIRGNAFTMTSLNGHFEVTGFPMPLDTLRFSGLFDDAGRAAVGASLYADITPPTGYSGAWDMYQKIFSVTGEAKGGQRNWLKELASETSLIPLLRTARVNLRASYNMMRKRIWSDWGFLNEQGKFVGTGTFQMEPIPQNRLETANDVVVHHFAYDKTTSRLTAEISHIRPDFIPAIVVIDMDTGHPLPMNYNLSTHREFVHENRKKVMLSPAQSAMAASRSFKAILMSDLVRVSQIEFQINE